MITFVIYYVPIPKKIEKSSKALLPSQWMSFDYGRMLNLTFLSAFLFHPECRMIILTSLRYQPIFSPQIADSVEVVRYDVNATQPMIGRCWAELQYLKMHDFASHVVMLDGDILVNANLNDIFQNDFAIGLTYRDNKNIVAQKMPINAGVKLVHSNNWKVAIQFMQQVYELCISDALAEFRTWWGDQCALIEAIGAGNFWHRQSDLIRVNGVKVQLLPCDIYNFSPRRKARGIRWELKEKKIIHFKGPRKQYMSLYWDLYLRPHSRNDIAHTLKIHGIRILLYLKVIFGLK